MRYIIVNSQDSYLDITRGLLYFCIIMSWGNFRANLNYNLEIFWNNLNLGLKFRIRFKHLFLILCWNIPYYFKLILNNLYIYVNPNRAKQNFPFSKRRKFFNFLYNSDKETEKMVPPKMKVKVFEDDIKWQGELDWVHSIGFTLWIFWLHNGKNCCFYDVILIKVLRYCCLFCGCTVEV